MIGSTVGRYFIEALLGEGGMGAVYRARDTQLDRTVAIRRPTSTARRSPATASASRSARAGVSRHRAAPARGRPALGGFETWSIPPEVDPINFAPRVKQPVLMVNGRDDFDLPFATAQLLLFKMLGTAAADKRHAVFEGGHLPPTPQLVYKEIIDWLDKYLGPVEAAAR